MEEVARLLPLAPVKPQALLVTGSFAGGEPDSWSDIDAAIIAPEESESITVYDDGRLITWSIMPLQARLAALDRPKSAPFAVAAYRRAVLVHDPEGLGSQLVQAARAWTWDRLDPGFAEQELTSIIEDVQKITAALLTDNLQRGFDASVVVLFSCAAVLAVRHQVLAESQNGYFTDICTRAADPVLTSVINGVTGLDGELSTLSERLTFALRLYIHAAEHESISSPVIDQCLRRIKAVLI